MMPVRHTCIKPDIELSYLEWNQGQQPLLLLHGMADNALVWLSTGEYLAHDYHIVAPDMRGHGESGKPEKDNYSFELAINDLEALMDKLGWSSAHVVAHSWSGKLAAIWARQNPRRLRSMILIDPIFIWKIPSIFKLTFPLLYKVLPFLQGMGPFPTYEAALEKARQMNQYKDWTPLQQEVFKASIEQNSNGTWGSKFTIAGRDGIFEEVMRAPGFTTPIDIPSLFIQPEKGVNRQEWQLKPYKTYLKNLQVVTVPGNHWAFLTKPEEFNRTVGKFLQAQKDSLSEETC
ncbi:alpha/beta hydrolase fold protein [Calothrix sp. NIES-4071]|nr:alpha/beta hydrolase fold protein [Calothrix sp. NIES-4071]BAZ56191.1 alpha/beta hydrolase fold protein [Calothrix sp. NIES-4105]